MFWVKRGRGRRTSQNTVLVRAVLKMSKMLCLSALNPVLGEMESETLSMVCDGL